MGIDPTELNEPHLHQGDMVLRAWWTSSTGTEAIWPLKATFFRWFAHLIWPWEGSNYPFRSCNGPNGPKGPKFKQNKQTWECSRTLRLEEPIVFCPLHTSSSPNPLFMQFGPGGSRPPEVAGCCWLDKCVLVASCDHRSVGLFYPHVIPHPRHAT